MHMVVFTYFMHSLDARVLLERLALPREPGKRVLGHYNVECKLSPQCILRLQVANIAKMRSVG